MVDPVGPRPPRGYAELLVDAFADTPTPYDEARARERAGSWPSFTRQPGFRCLTSYDWQGLAGVVYGWETDEPFATASSPFGQVERSVKAVLPDDAAWLQGRLSVVQVVVATRAQGAGLGQALIDQFVDKRSVWLVSNRRSEAHGWYLRRGWTWICHVGEDLSVLAR